MAEYKFLKSWTHPRDYMGSTWEGWYVVLGRTRDSNLLDQCNFDAMLKELGGESETCRVIRESHWACGWVEWIGVDGSDTATLVKAEDARARLDDYPLLDEEGYSNLTMEEAVKYWDGLGLSDRVEELRSNGESIFAARSNFWDLSERAYRTAEHIESMVQE